MSKKARDGQGRWRSKPVTFRMSPEENENLDMRVKLSGLTKQDYLVNRSLEREVRVCANPKVYKTLKAELARVYTELCRLSEGEGVREMTLQTIQMLALTLSTESMERREEV